MLVDLLIALALVLANGFFVATEFALARLRTTQVADLERDGRPGARSLRHAVMHLDAYLAACQLGITVASIGLGVVGEPAVEHLLTPLLGPEAKLGGVAVAGTLAFALITLLHVVIGELAPKSVAISRTTETGLRVAPPMRIFYLATKPLVDLFNGLGNLILRPFGIPPAREAGHAPHSESELLELLAQSGAEGLIEAEEQQIAERGFAFADRRAADVMQPREAIHFVPLGVTVADAAREAVRAGHSRLPVVDAERGIDAPMGLIHAHDLLAATLDDDDTIDLRSMLRPLARVPSQTRVTELLGRMLDERRHLVLVADDRGRTVGLLTLEDLVEELVGEIESDTDSRFLVALNQG
ncbi:MAG TPA: hemolysin family protein [Solirubrobacteraceae bacterium]|nr:hemolysin family protein [Solirubrobacteraceae bacterium]